MSCTKNICENTVCFILCLDVGRYKFDNLVCLTCGVVLNFFPLLFIFESFLTSIFVTKIPLHASVWNFLLMRIRFGLLFHVIKHIHTYYQCSICYLLMHLFPCVKDTN